MNAIRKMNQECRETVGGTVETIDPKLTLIKLYSTSFDVYLLHLYHVSTSLPTACAGGSLLRGPRIQSMAPGLCTSLAFDW